MTDAALRREPTPGAPAVTAVGQVKAIVVASLGNLIEWYDVYAYTAFAIYFAGAFFPAGDPVVQQLSAATLFAVSFLMRPVGSLLFGYLADRYGRRRSLTVSILVMCFGSLLVAVTPTYATIGVWAPVLLSAARILQGLSQGGEYGASVTYLSEISTPRHRGLSSGIWYATLIGGQLCAILVLLVLQKLLLSPADLKAWGWRIPFAIGALLSLYGFRMRRDLGETEKFVRQVPVREAVASVAARHWKAMAAVIGITVGGTSAFYTYTTYMQKYLKLTVGLTDDQTTLVTAGSLIVAVILQPLYGALSDRIGRKPLLIGFGVFGVPGHGADPHHAAHGPRPADGVPADQPRLGLRQRLHVDRRDLQGRAVSDLDPGARRRSALCVDRGDLRRSVDAVALSFKQRDFETGFFWYATALIAVSLVVCLLLPDTRKTSRLESDD